MMSAWVAGQCLQTTSKRCVTNLESRVTPWRTELKDFKAIKAYRTNIITDIAYEVEMRLQEKQKVFKRQETILLT